MNEDTAEDRSFGWLEREEDVENQLNKGALWAIVYGDLMSYLMLFFLILFVFTASKALRSQFSLLAVEKQFGKEHAVDVEEIFSKHGIQKIAKIEITESKIRTTFLEPVLFASGSAKLKPSSKPHLNRLAKVLVAIPNRVEIEGHTDNVPVGRSLEFASNWELSAARAFAVLRHFIESGVSPSNLSALGYGEFQPVTANDTIQGRAANRRIEINIIKLD